MAFSFSIPDIKSDLVGLIKSLQMIKLNYQSRAVIFKLLSTDPNNSDVNETMKKLGLSSTENPPESAVFKFVESLPKLLSEIIKDNPDYETQMKIDNNFIFSILVAKAINQLIEEYHQEFHKFTEAERNEIIQNQIESEKNNEGKFKDQLIQLQKLENEKREQLLVILMFLQAMKQQYQELQQKEIELTIELKKNVSNLIGEIFKTVDGKHIPQEVQNNIAKNVVIFLKEVISENSLKNGQINGRKHDGGRFFPDNKDGLGIDSLRGHARINGIVKDEYIKNGLQVDEKSIAEMVAVLIKKTESPNEEINNNLTELSSIEIGKEAIKVSYSEFKKDVEDSYGLQLDKAEDAMFEFEDDDLQEAPGM
jgi:hypothetical protein